MKIQQIKLYQPTQPQIDLLKVMHERKPTITLANFGRQTGKTYCTSLDAIKDGMNKKKLRLLYISPTYENNQRIISDIEALFEGRETIRDTIFKQIKHKEQEFVFHNGSVLAFRSAEQGNTLRGRKADIIYIDEAAFIAESTIVEILLPMITRTNGRMVLTSTPNGRNWFYNWFNQGCSDHPLYDEKKLISIKRTYKDLNDPAVNKIVEVFRSIMTTDQFNREVMAEFITDDTLFNNVESCIYKDEYEYVKGIKKLIKDNTPKVKDGDQLFIGIDVGVSNDRTVVTVCNSRNEVIEIDAFNMREDKLDHKEFKDRIMRLYYKYYKHLVACYVEVNNQELLFDELEMEYKDTHKMFPISMQTELKGQVISNLRFLFDKMKIAIPDNTVLINELYGYVAKRSMLSGRLQYSNKGVEHDDYVMSLAIVMWCVHEELNSGVIETY